MLLFTLRCTPWPPSTVVPSTLLSSQGVCPGSVLLRASTNGDRGISTQNGTLPDWQPKGVPCPQDFLERRLQTLVFKLGLAKSMHHARVLIRQRHIRCAGLQFLGVALRARAMAAAAAGSLS